MTSDETQIVTVFVYRRETSALVKRDASAASSRSPSARSCWRLSCARCTGMRCGPRCGGSTWAGWPWRGACFCWASWCERCAGGCCSMRLGVHRPLRELTLLVLRGQLLQRHPAHRLRRRRRACGRAGSGYRPSWPGGQQRGRGSLPGHHGAAGDGADRRDSAARHRAHRRIVAFTAVLFVGGLLAAWLLRRSWWASLARPRRSGRARRCASLRLPALAEAVAPYDRRIHRARAGGVSLVFNLLQIGWNVAIGWGLGLRLPLSVYFVFVPLTAVALLLPAFGGLGVRELSYVGLFGSAACPQADRAGAVVGRLHHHRGDRAGGWGDLPGRRNSASTRR